MKSDNVITVNRFQYRDQYGKIDERRRPAVMDDKNIIVVTRHNGRIALPRSSEISRTDNVIEFRRESGSLPMEATVSIKEAERC